MARTAADLRQVEELLRQAQTAPADERLWLLTVTWQLLHEITTDLAPQLAAPAPIATGSLASSGDLASMASSPDDVDAHLT